jgi:protein-disulfide isomerase
MSTTAVPDRFTTLPDENNLQATVVALEEHGFSVEVVDDLDAAQKAVLERIQRDVDSGLASGQVLGTPTLFIDGVVHRGGYDPPTLLAALATSE